jgi:1-acyl-sn-glycerol-3-phosphate acyltransferase
LTWLRGYYRLSLAALSLGLGGTLIVLTAWIPLEVKGYRPSFWILQATVRVLLFVFNVKVDCQDRESFLRHEGFVFPNHVTYLDILVLISVAPVRFLAKKEVLDWFVVGSIAKAIGCVFVDRGDKKSRAAARAALAKVDLFPPVALFPEGKRGPGESLLPFRYGAFEIVEQSESTLLPCIIVYDRLHIAIWSRGEHAIKAFWRLASHAGPIVARLVSMEVLEPGSRKDPVALSLELHASMSEQHRLLRDVVE